MKSFNTFLVFIMLALPTCRQKQFFDLKTDIFPCVKKVDYPKESFLLPSDSVFFILNQYRSKILEFAQKQTIDTKYDSAVYIEHFDIKLNTTAKGYYAVYFSCKDNKKKLYYFKIKSGEVSVSSIDLTRDIESEYLKWMNDANNSMSVETIENTYKDDKKENYLIVSMSTRQKKMSTLTINPFWTLMFKPPVTEGEKLRHIQLMKIAYLFRLTGEGSPF